MNIVKSGHISSVQDEIGNIKTYYVNDTLPECYRVPEDYYTNGIVEKIEEKKEYKTKKIKEEVFDGLK